MSTIYGFPLPFTRATGSLGYFEVTRNQLDAIKSNLTSLLLTNWGERLMHYHFGCNLIEFLFEQKIKDLKNIIADRILDQISKWMPFLSIDELNVFFTEDDPSIIENSILIRLKFSLNRRPDINDSILISVTP